MCRKDQPRLKTETKTDNFEANADLFQCFHSGVAHEMEAIFLCVATQTPVFCKSNG